MSLHKIFKIIAYLLGVVGIITLVTLLSKGDDAIKEAAMQGDTSAVDPIAYIAYIILFLVLFFVVVFVLKNTFTSGKSLKGTLIGIGSFALLALISYFGFAEGVETPLRDGGLLSESGSKLVGAGLYMVYFLLLIAGGTMLFFGLKKMIK